MSKRYEKSYGGKYDADLDIVEIAKRVKSEIREASKNGDLPEMKVSVTTDRYSGGQSLSVRIKTLPEGFEVCNPEYVEKMVENPHGYDPVPRYSEKMRDVISKVEGIVGAYNYDGSDSMIDYFDVNFYTHVNLDDDSSYFRSAKEAYIAAKNSEPEFDDTVLARRISSLIVEVDDVLADMDGHPLAEEVSRAGTALERIYIKMTAHMEDEAA